MHATRSTSTPAAADDRQAGDALQEAFLKCWRHHAGLGEIDNLKAWIFRIALNTARDVRRAAWRRLRTPMSGDELMLATNDPSPHAQVENKEQLARVRQALGA